MTRFLRIVTAFFITALFSAALFMGCKVDDELLVGLEETEEAGGGSSSSSGFTTLTPSSDASWTTGSLTSSTQERIYRFYASSYTSYTVYWDDSYQGTSAATVDVKVTASTSSEFSSTLWTEDSGYSSGKSVYLYSSGYVYLKVYPYSSGRTGTFRIRVTAPASTSIKSDTVSGSFSYGNGANIYSFTASAYTTYSISWTNSNGTVAVATNTSSTFSSSGSTSSPLSYYNSSSYSRTVYIKVAPYGGYDSNAGSFTMTVSTTSSSASTVSISTYSTNAGSYSYFTSGSVWSTGYLASSSSYIICRFYASSSGYYYLKWDDSYEGSRTYTADVFVSSGSSSSNVTSYFTGTDSGYSSPKSFYVSSGNYVYIKIYPWGSSVGTFGICAYNSSNVYQTLAEYSVYN